MSIPTFACGLGYSTLCRKMPHVHLVPLNVGPDGGCRRYWVSGSSETKTYGKRAMAREHEEQHMLPRRSFFGTDAEER
jgi:hypothetical protein